MKLRSRITAKDKTIAEEEVVEEVEEGTEEVLGECA